MRLVICIGALLSCAGEYVTADTGRGPGATPGTTNPTIVGEPKDFITSPQVRRLSRAEYRHTIEDLFGQAPNALAVPLELSLSGHSTIAAIQQVGFADSQAFLEAAETVSESVSAGLDTQLGTCAAADCTRTWVTSFLTKAFREAPAADVVSRYQALLTQTDAGPRSDRMKTFVVATLTSPHFVYRKEIGTEVAGSDLRQLSNSELASRLSYLIWQSAPDNSLLNANLSEPAERLSQLTRLLVDPKGKRGFRAFVRDWLALNENKIPTKTGATLAGTSANLADDAEASVSLLIDDVVAKPSGTFSSLLSTDQVFVNRSLAPLMGLSSTSATFERQRVTGTSRVGVLSQPLVLSAHSKESGVSPFIMGKFLLENVLCEEVGNPPAVFPNVPDDPMSTKTLREDLESRTSSDACIVCHRRIGPVGFSYLPFDPIGRFNPKDGAGRPFDTTGTLTLQKSQAVLQFSNSAELGKALSQAKDLQTCVARRVFRFAHGRYESPQEETHLIGLETAAVDTNAQAEKLLREVVSHDSFARVPVKKE
jgi:hypothetical protein